MTLLRRLSCTSLVLAFAQIVFGAIVRITGSGMGCGDHWPRCHGEWIPPLNRPDLIIEWTHRFLALALGIALVALFLTALRRRNAMVSEPDATIDGPRAVLRMATVAGAMYLAAAIFGAITVKLDLHAIAVVVHLAIAMTLLATLAAATLRAGGLGARAAALGGGSPKTARGARAAAGLVFVILILGALTANLPGAAASCQGFPLCRNGYAAGGVHVQLTHRVLAFLLFAHLLGLVIATSKRVEAPVVRRAVRIAFATVVLQLLVAAALVEMFLPPSIQSTHQAVGTLVWLATFVAAALAARASRAEGERSAVGDQGVAPHGELRAPAGAPTAAAMLPAPPAPKPHTVAVIIARGAEF